MTEQTRKSRREQKGKPKAHKTRQIHKKQACMYISYTLTYLHRERRHFCLLAGNNSEGEVEGSGQAAQDRGKPKSGFLIRLILKGIRLILQWHALILPNPELRRPTRLCRVLLVPKALSHAIFSPRESP